MKKKAIKEIPFKRPKRLKDGLQAEAQSITIDGVPHLFLDQWEDKQPSWRYILTKKDHGRYWVASDEWDGAKLNGQFSWFYDFGMAKDVDEIAAGWAKENGYYEKDFKELAREVETEQLRTAQVNNELRRRFKLQQRAADLQELPEDWEEYINNVLSGHKLYYYRHGRFTTYWCSHCGTEYTVANKQLETYEGQFEYYEPAPSDGEEKECLHCKQTAVCKPRGREKNGSSITKYIYLAQTTKSGGFVTRYFQATKEFRPGATERVDWVEASRTYIRDGKSQRDFQKYDCYLGERFWDDCNLAGLSNIRMYQGVIHPATWDAVADSYLKYVPVRDILDLDSRLNFAEFTLIALKWPQLEMLMKLGFEWAVQTILQNQWTTRFDVSTKKPWEFFKIKKDRMAELECEPEILQVLQLENKLNAHWNDDELQVIGQFNEEDVKTILKYMSAEKMVNRVCEYCGFTKESLQTVFEREKLRRKATLYADYLHMKDAAGFDMTNSVYLHPRNLDRAHAELVERRKQIENEKFLKEKEEKFKNIPKRYRSANRHFKYESGELFIRPARTATEIILEGRIQHHCVGGDNYLDKHNRGKTYICFLRFKEDKKTPYYTVELDWEYNVLQFYAAHDKQPQKAEIETWLNTYKETMLAKLQQDSIGAQEAKVS